MRWRALKNRLEPLTIVTNSSILAVVVVISNRIVTILNRSGCEVLHSIVEEWSVVRSAPTYVAGEKLKLPRLSYSPIQINTCKVQRYSPIQNYYQEKCTTLFSNRKQTDSVKQSNEVYFYGSHVRQVRMQSIEKFYAISLTNGRPGLTTENYWIKEFQWTHIFSLNKDMFFIWKKSGCN